MLYPDHGESETEVDAPRRADLPSTDVPGRRSAPSSDRSGPMSLSDAILQAKLSVGPVGDPLEREADDVADRVVRSLRAGSGSERHGLERENADQSVPPIAQRIQRSAAIGAAGGPLDADTDRRIQATRGGGRSMPADAQRRMEGAFGADFSGVRFHEGPKATELNDRIQAKAFTVGNDIYFRDGMPDTASRSGQELLAHELTHTLQQGGAARRSPVVRRRRDRRRRMAMSGEQMAPMILDLSMEELRTGAELAMEGIERQTTEVVDEQSSRAANRIAASLTESELVLDQLHGMVGLDKAKGLAKRRQKRRAKAAKRRADADPTGIDARLADFQARADAAMSDAEQRRIAASNQRDDLTDTEQYQRQLLVDKQRKRSHLKQKQVNKRDKKGVVKDPYSGTDQVQQAGDVEFVEQVDKKKMTTDKKTGKLQETKKFKKANKKRQKESATHVVSLLGKQFLQQSEIFRRTVADFGMNVGTSVRGALAPVEQQHHADLFNTITRASQKNLEVRNGLAAGTMSADDARLQAQLTSDRAKAIAGTGGIPNGFVARYTQKIARLSETAADSAWEAMNEPAVRDFEERLAQSMRKVRQQDEDGGYSRLSGLEKRFDTNLGPVSSPDDQSVKDMRDEFRAFVTDQSATGLNDQLLADTADQAIDLGFEKSLKSVFQIIAKQGVPNPEKAGTLGSNKSVTFTVSVPVDPSGIGRLELEFAVTGSCYPDASLWVQTRMMIKGGVEAPVPGVKIKAMAGLGFYLEAGGRDHERLGTLLSFALFRRFRESALVPHQITDFLWGRAGKAGADNGEWKDKASARYDHANKWGAAVEESFENDEYAESGGLVRAEAAAEFDTMVGGIHALGAGASMEYQRGTRYTKQSMGEKRAKHEDKYAKGKYKAGTAHTTGFGVRERGIGETNNRFTFNANGNVGPFGAAVSAGWWGAEKEWWIDVNVAATGGDFAGDPASVAARVATWAGQMAALGGGIIVQADEKRRKGQTVDPKDLKNLKKASKGVTELGQTMGSVITGQWASDHAAWNQAAHEAATAPDVARDPTAVINAVNEAGANHDGSGLVNVNDPTGLTGSLTNQINNSAINSGAKKLVSQAGAGFTTAVGLEKAKSLKILMRIIARPGDGRQSEIQFHVLNEKSKTVNLLDLLAVNKTKDFPIFYAQLPSKKVIWMGGIGMDQVKRAVRHQREVGQVASRHAPGGERNYNRVVPRI